MEAVSKEDIDCARTFLRNQAEGATDLTLRVVEAPFRQRNVWHRVSSVRDAKVRHIRKRTGRPGGEGLVSDTWLTKVVHTLESAGMRSQGDVDCGMKRNLLDASE